MPPLGVLYTFAACVLLLPTTTLHADVQSTLWTATQPAWEGHRPTVNYWCEEREMCLLPYVMLALCVALWTAARRVAVQSGSAHLEWTRTGLHRPQQHKGHRGNENIALHQGIIVKRKPQWRNKTKKMHINYAVFIQFRKNYFSKLILRHKTFYIQYSMYR